LAEIYSILEILVYKVHTALLGIRLYDIKMLMGNHTALQGQVDVSLHFLYSCSLVG